MERNVTFIVPVYDPGEYLLPCTESILLRSDLQQLILVDDGSTDGSSAVCDELAMRNSRVRAIHVAHGGVSAARNKGIELAEGKWICFVDADDLVEPVYPWENVSQDQEPDLIFLNYKRTDESSWQDHARGMMKSGELIGRRRLKTFVRYNLNRYLTRADTTLLNAPWAKMYRTDFLREHGIHFCEALPTQEDKLFNLYAMQYAESAVYVCIPFYHYRILRTSKAHRYSAECIAEMDFYLREVQKFLSLISCQELHQEDFDVRVIMVLMYDLFLELCHRENPESYPERKKRFLILIEVEPYRSSIRRVSAKAFPFAQRVIYHLIATRQFGLINLACRFYRI